MNINNLVALFWVLAAALPTLWLIRPIMVSGMGTQAFIRRRNLWLATTVLVFASPGYWAFVATLIVLLSATRKRENNIVSLYFVLMLAIPNSSVELPKLGNISLLNLDSYMILTVVLLLPSLMQSFRNQKSSEELPRGISSQGLLLWVVIFYAIQVAVWMPVESLTHSLRRGTSFLLGTIILYMSIQRLLKEPEQLKESFYALLMGITLMASIALVESMKFWQLYAEVASQWHGALRSTASVDSPITLGQLCMMGIIILLHLYDHGKKNLRYRLLCMGAILVCATYVTRSRAPWVSGFIGIAVYLWHSPTSKSRLPAFLGIIGTTFLALSQTQYGERIIEFLPYTGKVLDETARYREQMSLALWRLMWDSPILGSTNFGSSLEHLRQGQGIIDLLNVYLVLGAAFGIPCLAAFIFCLLRPIVFLYKTAKRSSKGVDSELRSLSSIMLAMLIGHMVFMYTISFLTTVEKMVWILIGLATSRAVQQRSVSQQSRQCA